MTDHNENKNGQSSRKAVVALGMHRSGTSALAGLLIKLGGDGPSEVLGPSANNPAGHFESRALYLMQDELLETAGSTWYDYRSFPENWYHSPKAEEFKDRISQLLQDEFGNSSFFVVKDPRNCRLVPFWIDILKNINATPLFVHIHRNPMEVAQSLRNRNGFDIEYGCLLWLRHILDAEAGSRGQLRSFTSYDRLLQNWPSEAEKISLKLGVSWPRYNTANLSDIDSMIRPDLKHNAAAALTKSRVFAAWFRDVLSIFDHWAEHGERTEDHTVLDAIRQTFNSSAEVFGDSVLPKGRALTKQLDAAQKKAEAATNQAEGAYAKEADFQKGLNAAEEKLGNLAQKLSEREDTLRQREAELEAAKQQAEAAAVQAEDVRAKLEQARTQSTDLQKELDTARADRGQLQEGMALRDNMLQQSKAEIDDTLNDLHRARLLLKEAENSNESLAQALKISELHLEQAKTIAVRRNREFADIQIALVRYQDELASLRAQRATNHKTRTEETRGTTHSVDLSTRIHPIEKNVTAEIASLQYQLRQSEERVVGLLSSNSWKITAPIRWVVERFRK